MLKIKNDFYVSFNQDELFVMLGEDMSLEEQGLYFLLKTVANFQTGIFGKFRQQKMSYAELGRRLSRPASQGKPARTFDASQIIRLLERLEERKLVTDRHIEEKTDRLVMRLPLSPIVKKSLPEVATTNAEKLPREVAQQSPAIADGTRFPDDSSSAPSVLFSQRENKPFSNTVNTDVAENRPRLEPPKVSTADVPLSAAAIEAAVRDAGGQYPSTEISRRFYESWVRHGLTKSKLDEAIAWHMALDFTFNPGDLDRGLFPRPSPRKPVSANRRGGLVL